MFGLWMCAPLLAYVIAYNNIHIPSYFYIIWSIPVALAALFVGYKNATHF